MDVPPDYRRLRAIPLGPDRPGGIAFRTIASLGGSRYCTAIVTPFWVNTVPICTETGTTFPVTPGGMIALICITLATSPGAAPA
jgi:hypothetical protein